MLKERKLQILRISLGHETSVKGDEAAFFCPKHGRRAGRTEGQLGINLVTDRFNCWSCGFSGGNLYPLLNKGSQERREYADSRPKKQVEAPEKKYDSVVLPNEFRSLSKDWGTPYYNAAVSYLRNRNFSREDILSWKLGYCEDGEYKYRIIIPSFDQYGHLNFFTGRTFYDNKVRYKNGNFNKDIVFNDYMIDWGKDVIITEGPFDAMRAGENAIPLQGDLLSEGSLLFEKILSSGSRVFFAMDADAFDKQLKIIETSIAYGVDCFYVDLCGKKDVGEMTREEFRDAKENARHVAKMSDILKLRIGA